MSGHDLVRASMVSAMLMRERERQALHRMRIKEAKAARAGQIGNVTWFGGIKATARFLSDAAHEALAQRRMTTVQG